MIQYALWWSCVRINVYHAVYAVVCTRATVRWTDDKIGTSAHGVRVLWVINALCY